MGLFLLSVAAIERVIATNRTERIAAGSDDSNGIMLIDEESLVKADAEGAPRY